MGFCLSRCIVLVVWWWGFVWFLAAEVAKPICRMLSGLCIPLIITHCKFIETQFVHWPMKTWFYSASKHTQVKRNTKIRFANKMETLSWTPTLMNCSSISSTFDQWFSTIKHSFEVKPSPPLRVQQR